MNINKNLLTLSLLLAAIGSCSMAEADTQTVSLGYSNAKMDGFKNIHGVTAKYHYQPENSLGFISSLTYMDGTEKFNDYGDKGKVQLKYYSLLVGPSYRVNEFISLYGLVGAAHGKEKGSLINAKGVYVSGKIHESGFAYGAGVQIAPAANWSIDVGYEGSTFREVKINGFNIGLGYHF